MTVSKLITELQALDGDLTVVTCDSEAGTCEVTDVDLWDDWTYSDSRDRDQRSPRVVVIR